MFALCTVFLECIYGFRGHSCLGLIVKGGQFWYSEGFNGGLLYIFSTWFYFFEDLSMTLCFFPGWKF